MDKIAVLITCYNQEEIIKKTIDSMLNQSLENDKYTIYVSDDQSTDNSYEVLKEISSKYNNVIVKQNPNKKLVGANRNNLISMIDDDCKYALFVDGDDAQDKDYLKTIYEQLDDHLTFSVTNFTEVWSDTKTITKDACIYDNFMFRVYQTKLLKTLSVNEELKIGEDVEFSFRYHDELSKDDKIIEANYLLNRRDDNISLTKNSDIKKRLELEEILYNYIKDYNNIPDLSTKIENKKVELIQLQVMCDQKVENYIIDTSKLGLKFKLSYFMYQITKKIGLVKIYKSFLIKKIGYKI